MEVKIIFNTKDLEELLRLCGILLRDSNGKIRSFTEVLADINKIRKMLTDAQIKVLYHIMFFYKGDKDTSDNDENFRLTNEEIEMLADILVKLTYEKYQQNDEIKLHDKVKIIKGDSNYLNAIGRVIIIDDISFGGKTKYLIDFRANKNQSVGYDDYNNYCVWFNREDIIKI